MREHKFKYNFQDTINPLCSYGLDIESTEHFLLHCPQLVNERRTLLSTIGNIAIARKYQQTLFFGNTSFDITGNIKTLKFLVILIIIMIIIIIIIIIIIMKNFPK